MRSLLKEDRFVPEVSLALREIRLHALKDFTVTGLDTLETLFQPLTRQLYSNLQ